MFASIASVLLSITSASAPSAHCDECLLTRPLFELATSDRLAIARVFHNVLLAQAELPPPPLPDSSTSVSASGPSARELELSRQIDELNRQARAIDVNWPTGYIVLAYLGYVVAPSGILGGGAILLIGITGLAAGASEAAVVAAVGGVILAIGLAGLGAILHAWIAGSQVADEKRKHREELVKQREQLERELEQLRSQSRGGQGIPQPQPQMLTLLTF